MSYTGAGDNDVVGIKVGTASLYGWQELRITRGIENCPSTFEMSLTERYPANSNEIVITPGDSCVVTIGADTIVTGYVLG